MISLDDLSFKIKCLVVSNMMHGFGIKNTHIHMKHLNKLVKHDLVIGLSKIKFIKYRSCDAYQRGSKKSIFKPKNVMTTTRPLQLLHMDLFGTSRTRTFGGNVYALVIIMDFLDIL